MFSFTGDGMIGWFHDKIEFDGNYARRVYPPPRWYWVCMGFFAAILLAVCIHAAVMCHAGGVQVQGIYEPPTQSEIDRAITEYEFAAIDRDE